MISSSHGIVPWTVFSLLPIHVRQPRVLTLQKEKKKQTNIYHPSHKANLLQSQPHAEIDLFDAKLLLLRRFLAEFYLRKIDKLLLVIADGFLYFYDEERKYGIKIKICLAQRQQSRLQIRIIVLFLGASR